MEEAPRPRRRTSSGSSKNKKNLSKEQLMKAVEKKRQCDAKAQAIVIEMLETVEDAASFLLKIKDINQCHYEDIIEERAIIKLCGYPLCKEKLVGVPSKQYHISIKTNRVYDISERKNFCSNSCYKASNYIKEQLLTSPLWLRDAEIIPEFELLSLDDK